MRLLNVYTFKLAEFEGKNVPQYAVASHRWCDNEATFVDVDEGKNTDGEGYKKVVGFCEFVKWRNENIDASAVSSAKIEWIWIDTCCIDRRSSAEIAENITSMYKYYEQSVECYAYLPDVPQSNDNVKASAFRKSSWFTRGWTLQELLAPSRVFFLSSSWSVFGHKCSKQQILSRHKSYKPCRDVQCSWANVGLNAFISQITGIDREVLEKRRDPKGLSADQICKWIENRVTKKEEDLAYCLLGLFGVFMVPNYGEGENAWSRLEEEVSKKRKQALSLPRPSQLRPDEERYEPSIFAEPPLKPSANSQHYRISPGSPLDLLPVTPDSEPDDWLHGKHNLPTLNARNGSRRRRRSFDSTGWDTRPYSQLPSDKVLDEESRERRLHFEMVQKLELELKQKRREEEEMGQRFQAETEKKRKEEYELELRRKQRDEEEVQRRYDAEKKKALTERYEFELARRQREEGLEVRARVEAEEKDRQRRRLKHREEAALAFERQNAGDIDDFGDSDRQLYSRSRSRNSGDRVVLHQATSSPDLATASRTASWGSSLGALNPLRLLQPSPSQTANDKTEEREAHDTTDQLFFTRPALTRRTRYISPHRHYTLSNDSTGSDDGSIIVRNTDRVGGKNTPTIVHIGRGYRSTRTHNHSRRRDGDFYTPQDVVITQA